MSRVPEKVEIQGPALHNDGMQKCRFLEACARQEVDRPPVWFMRQAGRYLPEYRELRKSNTLLEICRDPELTAEVTLQPIRRFGFDAAIIFADILLPLPVMGVSFDFAQGEGPVIARPVKTPEDVALLREGDPEEELSFVFAGLRRVREELSEEKALIGFAGAPFTVASYMIEGGHSRNFVDTKLMMYRFPDAWDRLMRTVSTVVTRYLREQIRAGAQAIQLFDSWVGCLAPSDYRKYVLPYSRSILEALSPEGVPLIHFGTGTATLLELMKEAGGSVIGIDWRVPLSRARQRLGGGVAVQGNLDPVALLGPSELLREKVLGVLEEAGSRPGHIFNLGHGILPPTPLENVETVLEVVQAHRF